jgi:uncharacterized membrane protein
MSAEAPRPTLADRALDAVGALAVAVWLGGYATLGAVVAPLVFGMVPAPTSGDAMTAVFQRFDRVALACAAVALVCEAGHAALRARPLTRLDMSRAALLTLAAGVAVVVATVVSPRIVALHQAGAVRGSGAAGLELDAVHHAAERLAKHELAALVAALVLLAARETSPAPPHRVR